MALRAGVGRNSNGMARAAPTRLTKIPRARLFGSRDWRRSPCAWPASVGKEAAHRGDVGPLAPTCPGAE